MDIRIDGPVLLLMGPLGSFFSRLADFLIAHEVSTYKVMFPLREYFPGKRHITFNYDRPLDEWRSYLIALIEKHNVRHMFMYGDFVIPHKIAIDLAREIGIAAWVFELGYIRPHYVTLERNRVNARSNLNQPASFYHALPDGQQPLKPLVEIANRWRRIFKPPCFIQHAFTNYPIVDGPHKLQPKPSYLFFQLLGWLRQPWYAITERRTRRIIRNVPSLFLVVLQVSSDSQVTLSSDYHDMEGFMSDVLSSFAHHSKKDQHLVFKHHPRDRGYNNYGSFIRNESRRRNIEHRVHYIHDDDLVDLIKHCSGVVTINSTVGLTAIKYNIPTKVVGKTFYDLPGLTSQVSLDEFWQTTYLIQRDLFIKFYNFLIEQTQINGNFDGYFPFEDVFSFG